MNSQRFAQLRISPLRLQQGLFASLALLVTLVVGQQFQRWDSHQETLQIQQPFTPSHTYNTVSAPVSKETALSFQPVQGVTATAELPRQQSWVF